MTAEVDLNTFKMFIQSSYDRKAKEIMMSDIDALEGTKGKLKYFLEMMQETSVAETLLHLESLENAIRYERQQKDMKTKVADLEITLLS